MTRVDLPVMPPLKPMLAKAVAQVPGVGALPGGVQYEPKWDGFRCIVYRDGEEVELGSRSTKPLTRYFPEVVEAVLEATPERCVLDAEVVVVTGDRLDFEALLQRVHPAASRVRLLSTTTPALLVVFDLLALGDRSLVEAPLSERRALLEQVLPGTDRVRLTPVTQEQDTAQEWFSVFEGAGLDGVVAKGLDSPYAPDKRTMLKIKHLRTADCVVAGYRWHKTSTAERPLVGSLLLGLVDGAGELQHVGVCGSFTTARRGELVAELEPYAVTDLAGHPWASWAQAQTHEAGLLPGATSRWNATKDLSWVPLAPELVVEVAYDHMEGTRFRHTAQFRTWRPDRDAASCTYDQLEVPVRFDLGTVLGTTTP